MSVGNIKIPKKNIIILTKYAYFKETIEVRVLGESLCIRDINNIIIRD